MRPNSHVAKTFISVLKGRFGTMEVASSPFLHDSFNLSPTSNFHCYPASRLAAARLLSEPSHNQAATQPGQDMCGNVNPGEWWFVVAGAEMESVLGHIRTTLAWLGVEQGSIRVCCS